MKFLLHKNIKEIAKHTNGTTCPVLEGFEIALYTSRPSTIEKKSRTSLKINEAVRKIKKIVPFFWEVIFFPLYQRQLCDLKSYFRNLIIIEKIKTK